MIKAGAQRVAAELGLALVTPDTSPRGTDFPGQADSWDFGVGAGFYVDATEAPWKQNWRMYSYVTKELPPLIAANYPVDPKRRGIFGHSMGGHGALTLRFEEPRSLSNRSRPSRRFPTRSTAPGARRPSPAISGRIGRAGQSYDASELMKRQAHPAAILVDQGEADQFLGTAIASPCAGSRRASLRPEAHPAPPCRLRSRLLLHPELHRQTICAITRRFWVRPVTWRPHPNPPPKGRGIRARYRCELRSKALSLRGRVGGGLSATAAYSPISSTASISASE